MHAQESAALALLLNGIFAAADFAPAINVVLVGQVTFVAGDPPNFKATAAAAAAASTSTTASASAGVAVDALIAEFDAWRTLPTTAAAFPHDHAQVSERACVFGVNLAYRCALSFK